MNIVFRTGKIKHKETLCERQHKVKSWGRKCPDTGADMGSNILDSR
jgi:hypothetical protein